MIFPVNFSPPPLAAKYRAVFWEPVTGTGERIVALVSIENDTQSARPISSGSHVVLSIDRLRSMLGKQRGSASAGVLLEVAAYLTNCQENGAPIDQLVLPFQGLTFGPVMPVRGYTADQLLNAAVRTVSAFGSADSILDDEPIEPRNSVKTTAFLRSLKRYVAGDDELVKARFDKRLTPKEGLPDVTIDYAFKQWMVQVTTLPVTHRQAAHAQREAQSKLYELDLVRRVMDDNKINPMLMVNEDALTTAINDEQRDQALQMLERLRQLSRKDGLDLVETNDAEQGAKVLLELC
jgi:hypothetical protein